MFNLTMSRFAMDNAILHLENVKHVFMAIYTDDDCCDSMETFHNGSRAETLEVLRSFPFLNLVSRAHFNAKKTQDIAGFNEL